MNADLTCSHFWSTFLLNRASSFYYYIICLVFVVIQYFSASENSIWTSRLKIQQKRRYVNLITLEHFTHEFCHMPKLETWTWILLGKKELLLAFYYLRIYKAVLLRYLGIVFVPSKKSSDFMGISRMHNLWISCIIEQNH